MGYYFPQHRRLVVSLSGEKLELRLGILAFYAFMSRNDFVQRYLCIREHRIDNGITGCVIALYLEFVKQVVAEYGAECEFLFAGGPFQVEALARHHFF